MQTNIKIRPAKMSDHDFIYSLSPALAQVAQLEWHSEEEVQRMQDDYIREMLIPTTEQTTTLIAELDGQMLGFVHVRTRIDGISNEIIGTVPLLAVSPNNQRLGVGRLLMNEAEKWAKSIGCRLLHLEVFTNNKNALEFYCDLGFQPELLHMIKPIA